MRKVKLDNDDLIQYMNTIKALKKYPTFKVVDGKVSGNFYVTSDVDKIEKMLKIWLKNTLILEINIIKIMILQNIYT